ELATPGSTVPTAEAARERGRDPRDIPGGQGAHATEPGRQGPDRPAADDADANAIAVVGMACRFPGGADTPDAFWQLLEGGVDAIGRRDFARFDPAADPLAATAGAAAASSRPGGFLSGLDAFDAMFFRISPKEAQLIDPQQRLLLETAWEALEQGGIAAGSLAGSNTGVFVGLMHHDYETLTRAQPGGFDATPRFSTGNAASIAAGRIAYFFDWHGPTLAVDTACSSSLVALHLACESLLARRCDAAMAAGVNLLLGESGFAAFEAAGMLSPESRCKTFDASANGYVRGEGCAAVLLKRLADARRDGDAIAAVIRGSAINHDGASAGLTVPNETAQRRVIEAALARAGLAPADVAYLEAHGTGTSLGDPIEVQAAAAALGAGREASRPLLLGSVKTNIGHLESAAGIAGVMKVVLSMQHGTIPRHLHFEAPNPRVDWARLPVEVVARARAWPAGRKVAGVSSFAFSGTNAHVVIEAYPAAPATGAGMVTETAAGAAVDATPRPALVVLSARSEARLREQARRLRQALRDGPAAKAGLAAIAWTLQIGREPMSVRVAFAVGSLDELADRLARFAEQGRAIDATACWYGELAREREFADEAALEPAMRAARHGDWDALASVWVQGQAVPWHALHEAPPPRVSLPTYPFERQRHWVTHDKANRSRAMVQDPSSRDDDVRSKAEHAEPRGAAPALRLRDLAVPPADTAPANGAKPAGLRLRTLAASPGPASIASPVAEFATEPVASPAAALARAGRPANPVSRNASVTGASSTSVRVAPDLRELERELAASLAEALYLDSSEVDVDRPFAELGLDSIIGVEWMRAINRRHGLALNATLVYEHPTVRRMATRLAQALSEGPASAEPSPVTHAGPAAAMATQATVTPAPVARLPELERELAASLAEALYLDSSEIDVDRPFAELGLDSIIGVEWMRAINRRHGLALNATLVYEHPTVRRMAARLALALGEATPAAAAPAPATASAPAPASVPAQAPAGTRDLPAAPGPLPAAAPASATDHARPAAAPVQGTTTPHREHAPIAIIGIAGRYPGANGMDQYWDNLAAGRDSVEEIPPSRWNVADYYDADRRRPGKVYSKWLGRLDEMDCFDPLFFNISPAEAELMDPQQRLFLEESYRAFEDAGYDPRQLSEARCGVYLGIMGASEYGWLVQQHRGAGDITGTSAAIAAARIAYFLNLKGPAIPVDTACSSSLVATHLACQALRSGEIDLALAGGVTLYLSPEMYMSMCGAGMLSPDGRCKTLDNAADGFVPGEGVGTLVLKRLADAERDGDVIHGVIVGSGINQDGKTNGITAPNLASQIELEREVYARHAIDPDTIGCVELHGTGTKLGDPIELNALATVFREKTARRNYCALGSVKSNIGHTSAAAGVAGVHKVLLQMRHGQLAPTLHYRTPNEHFDFERSPFFVNTVLQPWPADDGRPRRAAVSSFGISGTNAHLVIEEYRPAVPRAGTAGPVLIVLSAKSAAQLRTQALQLRAALARDPAVGLDLASLAFTLQTGRAAFEQRIALVAESREHLVDTLDAWLREPKSAGVLSGEVRRTTEAASLFDGEAEFAELLASLVRNGKLRKLGELWVKGVAVDWSALYGAARPGRVSLPTYPFARERYWVAQDGSLAAPRPAAAAARMPADAAGQLHPLVHRNVSTFGRQRYRTVLRGDEFFLRDHLVSGRRVVPGVAQLEWARAAVADALADPAMTVRLEQVNWLRPLVAESALEVHVTLVPQQGGRIRFEIHSGSGEHARAHSQGFAVPVPLAGRAQPPRVDLAAWRARAAQPTEVAARYAHFERVGLRYGPSFRVMDQLRVGADHALAMLRWPAEAPAEGYAWPPSVLDGALQAGLGLVARDGGLELPFAMQAIEQWGPLPKNGISIVRRAADDSAAVRKLDVEIVDVDGRVAMRVSGFSTRPLGAPLAAGPLAPAAAPRQTAPAASIATASFASAAVPRRQPGELMLAPIWEAVEEAPSQAVAGLPRTVWLGAETASLDRPGWVARLQAEGRLEQLVWQVPAGVARVALVGLRLIQALLELGYGAQTLKLTVVTRQAQAVSPTETADPEQAGVHGLVGSLAKSYPKWQVRLLDLPRDGELASLEWQRVPADPRGDARAWREGRWYRQRLAPCSLPAVEASRFRHGGVYVVLGGAGSIGAAFSEHLIRRYRAQLVWLGRRPEDEAIRTQLSRLAALGPAPLYLSADATDRQALERARATILARFGTVHGIVHSAVVLGEAPLAALDEAGFAEVLATKATTCEQMDAVFGGDALDFQLFFSSAQSFTKTPRLSHYSAGCCHTDAYAHNLRNRPYAVRVMHWGYWGLAGDGAARFDQLMAQSGFAPIDPARGMEALEQLLAGPLGQLAFLSTTHGEGARAALGVSERETVQGLPSTPAVTLPERAEAAAPAGAREMQRLFERHLAHIVWAQLAGAGWLERDDGLAGFYGRWRQAALRLLAEQGIRSGERVPAHDALWAEWRAFVAQTREDPMLGAQVRLADVTLHALPEVLRGQRKPTELLFPQGQLHLVQGIYRDNPVADYFNEALAESLDAYLRERLAQQPDAAIRILEIGAGTGGTSVRLFARLAAHAPRVAEYCYTDLSPAFLMHAERHYRDAAPYLRTARLDIEQAPAGQGFAAGAYDLVVAANVLHATRDIHRTLRHTKHLLKANGVLLLNEVSRPSLFTHVTFGLLDGWWLAEDAALRIPGTPALSADSWRSVLGAEGFAPVGFPARHAHELGQQIVAAVSDGVIRRRSEPVDEPVNGAVDKTVSERSPAPTSAPVFGLAPEPVPTPVPVPTAPSSGTPQAWQLAARAVIRESIGQALKLGESRLDDDEAFSNYGVDSITGVALVETINARLGLDLPTTVLFDYVSIEQLSRYIATSRGERLASSSRPADPPPAPAASPRQAEAAQPASEARWLSVRAVIRE
ncbi:bongkrekic acid type I polyketide synthase BonA, partial [Burkholderia gladioli]